jgi:5-methylcytosine-specific restriction endonuclease McrA
MKSLPCIVDGCPSKNKARGLCHTHYSRWQSTRVIGKAERKRPQKIDPNAVCQIENCGKPVRSKNYCGSHYSKWNKYGDALWERPRKTGCIEPGCDQPYEGLDRCHTHYLREQYRRNRKRILAATKKRRKKNPEQFQNWYNTYRARKKAGSYFISPKDLRKLSTAKCAYCGSSDNLEIDHIIPLSRGGTHSIGNITKACRQCNASKSDRLVMEWRLGQKSKRYTAH